MPLKYPVLQDAGFDLTYALGEHILSRMNANPKGPANALGADLNAPLGPFYKGITTRKCAYCKRKFKPTRFWQKFCSVKCRNDLYWSTHRRETVPLEQET